jgi:hypothetical protein
VEISVQRAAENENLFRRVNERVDELAGEHDLPPIVCECADVRCSARLSVPRSEYERIRTHAEWFFVVPGHEADEIEAVVEVGTGWLVVAKEGAAAEVARADDPRSE